MLKKIVAALALTATLSSCAWLKKEGAAAGNAAIDCAKQDLGTSVSEAGMSILMTVMAILSTTGLDVNAALAQLEAKYTPELVACAVNVAEQLFRPAPSSTPSMSSMMTGPHDRALAVIKARGWKYR